MPGDRFTLPKATSPFFPFPPIPPSPPLARPFLSSSSIMPTCRRKRVLLTEPSPALLDALHNDPKKEVFYLTQTGEIFESYEYVHFFFLGSISPCSSLHHFLSAYAARMSFYRLRQFQCEVTGKSGLDYFQALESEQQEARTMHSRFPDPLKSAVLRAVQWREYRFFLLSAHVYFKPIKPFHYSISTQRLWDV